jgi:hypothetical protein
MPSILITAFRAGQQRLQAMLVLGALYALGFLVVMGMSALFDGGKFARLYLVGGQITRELALDERLPERHVGRHGAVPAAVAAVLARARAGALAWRAARQEPVLQLRGLHAQLQGLHAVRAWPGWACSCSVASSSPVFAALIGSPQVVGVAMVPGRLLMAAMFFTSVYFTFRDSFVAEPDPFQPETHHDPAHPAGPHRGQEVLWFQRRSFLQAAAAWTAMGGFAAAVAQQRSNIVELQGDALINGARLRRSR